MLSNECKTFFPYFEALETNSVSGKIGTLQMITGTHGHRFPLQYLWNRTVRITENPYIPQRERLCMLWGNPVIFTDCREIP